METLTSEERVPWDKLIGGVALIAIGGLFLADSFDLFDLEELWHYWPLVLVVMGVAKLFSADPDRRNSGFWLLGIGIWLLISSLGLFGLYYGNSWPLILIFIGIGMVWRSVSESRRREEKVDERQ